MTYVAPARRTIVQQPQDTRSTVSDHGKTVEPAVEVEKPESSGEKGVENMPAADKSGVTVAQPAPVIQKGKILFLPH